MKSQCPYIVLGVRRNATTSTIKKAYRKAVMACHPDRFPGDAEKEVRFKVVQDAYNLLSDPDRRKRYDETGATDVPKPQDVAELCNCLSQFLAKAVQGAQYTSPKRTDLVAKMKAAIDQEIRNADQELVKLRQAHADQTDIMNRFTTTGGENYLAGIVRQQVAGIEAAVTAQENKARVLRAAHDYLGGCKYRVDGAAGTPKDALAAVTIGQLIWGVS